MLSFFSLLLNARKPLTLKQLAKLAFIQPKGVKSAHTHKHTNTVIDAGRSLGGHHYEAFQAGHSVKFQAVSIQTGFCNSKGGLFHPYNKVLRHERIPLSMT